VRVSNQWFKTYPKFFRNFGSQISHTKMERQPQWLSLTVDGRCEVDKGAAAAGRGPDGRRGKPRRHTAWLGFATQDQVIRRSSCACIRPGCVGRTRTLKPYVPLSVAGTLP